MNPLEVAANVSTIAASLAVLVTTGFVWRQVSMQRENRETDAKRFARETLNAIHDHLQDPASSTTGASSSTARTSWATTTCPRATASPRAVF